MANFNTDAFFSAVKRKNMSDLLKIVFSETGFEDAATIAGETGRMTDAALTRIREALKEIDETDVADLYYQDVITEEAESNSELIKLEKKVRKAIEKGDAKKAKKALKKLKESGLAGTEVDKLEKEVKDMK